MKRMFKISFVFFLFFFLSSSVFSQEREIRKINQQNLKLVYINFADSNSKMVVRLSSLNNDIRTAKTAKYSSVETVNDWLYLGLYGTPDSTKIKSVMGQGTINYQGFSTFGGTMELNNINFIQSDWVKDFWSSYPFMPDTIAVDVKILSMTSNVKKFGMKIPVQDSMWWSSGPTQFLDINNSGWQILKVNMSHQKIDLGMTHLGKIYLSFQFQSKDSSYIGADIAVSNLRGIDSMGNVVVYDNFTLVGIENEAQIPSEFVLEQNYPNPFNPSTTIKFTIPKTEYVNLTVYNLLGQKVKTLVSEEKNQGSYEVVFNASNLPSGMYVYRLQAGNSVRTKKMILVK